MIKNMIIMFLMVMLLANCSKKKLRDNDFLMVLPKQEAPKYVDPEPEIQSIIDRITLPESIIYFDLNKAVLREVGLDALADLAQYLFSNQSVSLRINGHTCDWGTVEYNMGLGQARGQAVKKYLVDYGVEANRLEVVSWGEEKAFFTPRSLNRRVEYEKK